LRVFIVFEIDTIMLAKSTN